MDVFLIPVGPGRYELYCEVDVVRGAECPVEGDAVAGDDSGAENSSPRRDGYLRTRFMKFRERLRQAEWELHHGSPAAEPQSWRRRMSDKSLRWMAERIAEQRLLWQLRRCTEASLFYPADLSEEDAMRLLRLFLRLDAARHGKWILIDGILFLLTFVLLGPLFLLVPGVANLPAAYFAFRTVGHYFSRQGARQGLLLQWRTVPSEPLTELRRVISLEPVQRERRVSDIASALRLERLATFFERTVTPGA